MSELCNAPRRAFPFSMKAMVCLGGMPRTDDRMALWRFLTALVCTRKLLCFSLLNALKSSP